jgi:hypothetical protein
METTMRILRAGCAAAAGLAILAGLGGAAAAPTPDSAATVVVDTSQPGGRLPSDFVGLSFEVRELGIGNIDARRGNLAQFFRTLGRSNVRFSGNTLDRDAIWLGDGQQLPDPLPEWVQHIITPADIERLDEFLAATGWDTAVGINLGRWDAERAADQARVMSRVLGRRLLAAECGNEPDQWVSRGYRPAGYAYADYRRDWQMCTAAVGRIPLAGLDAASPTSTWAANLARDEGDRLKMIMIHQYSMDPTGTMERLLSPATNAGQAGAATPNLTGTTRTSTTPTSTRTTCTSAPPRAKTWASRSTMPTRRRTSRSSRRRCRCPTPARPTTSSSSAPRSAATRRSWCGCSWTRRRWYTPGPRYTPRSAGRSARSRPACGCATWSASIR